MTKIFYSLALACAITSTPLVAQRPAPVGYKDPGTSTLISIVLPGGGHIYSGETRKGAALLGIGLAGLTLGTAATVSSVGVSCGDYSCEDDTSYLPMTLGYVAYLGTWIYGIMDAGDSANRMNAARGVARLVPSGVTPVVAATVDGGTQVGLGLRF